MELSKLLDAIQVGEGQDWEFKSAQGGLPSSMWETYSAMANTDGGHIVLGLLEGDDSAEIQGVDLKLQRDLWNLLNNREKVSVNLLQNADVHPVEVNGKTLLLIRVPRATHKQRPVYVGKNPLTGTYRRQHEGDYRCSETEVSRMLADRLEEHPDSRILAGFDLTDLHDKSLKEYRQRFASRSPDHPWLGETDQVLLEKLGGWRRDRKSGETGLTVAGILMFGKQETICDPEGVPKYHVDYREYLTEDPKVRWSDRITLDGSWAGNLFQFYQRVIRRLTSDLKIPFRMENSDGQPWRVDDSVIHEALREALVNSLIHADYRGEGSIVIEKRRDRFIFTNPGTLLVSFEQLKTGGQSVCRNLSLQQMFLMIGGGERAGSGVDKIRQGWKGQHWRSPSVMRQTNPDRVAWTLPMVSLLPEETVEILRTRIGEQFETLSVLEHQALVTAELEAEVSNSRLQEMSTDHPTAITKALRSLVSKGLLMQEGKKRGATYCCIATNSSHNDPNSPHNDPSSLHNDPSSLHNDPNSPHNDPSSLHNDPNSPHNDPNSPHNDPNSPHNENARLALIAAPIASKQRSDPEQVEVVI